LIIYQKLLLHSLISDDKNGLVMLQNTKAKKLTYALKSYADYKATNFRKSIIRIIVKNNDNEVWVKLIGTRLMPIIY
jgi:UDP-N-acetylmuramoyl-L-alanyl-D-glutamate--2,6-diaminopimelate ligase